MSVPPPTDHPTAVAWPRRVTVCGIADLPRFADEGVSHVLSILDPVAETPAAFRSYPAPVRQELRFHDVVDDFDGYSAPQQEHVAAILAFGDKLRRDAGGAPHLLVHCHMGISRSTAAAAILLAQLRPGHEEAAFDLLHRIRPRAWPNSRMVAIADRLLDRGGRLVAALRRHQAGIIERHPDLADLVVNVGRGHELPR